MFVLKVHYDKKKVNEEIVGQYITSASALKAASRWLRKRDIVSVEIEKFR